MEFLLELDDQSKYVVKRGVPIARALRQKRPDGSDLVITSEDLPHVAEVTAAHEAESGTVLRVTLGHVKPGQPQESQPRLVGYARAVRAGVFGPAAVPCILSDVYTMRAFADSDDAGQYPFRSMEYRLDTGRISGLALLKTDPFSQLGVVPFGADVAHVAFMEAGMGEPGTSPPAGADGQAGGTMQMSSEDKQKADALFGYFMASNPWMAKCAADYGEQKPDGGDGDEKPIDKGDPPGRDDNVDKDKTAKMEADLESVKAENARLAREADEAKVDGLLAKFEAVYECDPAYERGVLLKFSADDRVKYLDNAKKRYSKKPVGSMIDTRTGPVEGGGPAKELDRNGMDAALAMMEADPSLSFNAAREKVLKG